MPDNFNSPRGNRGPGLPGEPRRAHTLVTVIVLAVVAYLIYTMVTASGGPATRTLPTNQFVTAVEQGRVADVSYKTSDGSVSGSFWEKSADKGDKSKLVPYASVYVGSDSLAELMAEHPNVTYQIDTDEDDLLEMILVSVVPTLLLVGVFVYYMSRMSQQQDRTMSFSKTKARTMEGERPKVTFADVAGIDEAVEELQEVRDFLSDPVRYEKMGARIPHGLLLVGPPGTGKTLLAKAVAGEAGVPFFSISGSDFVEMSVGVGASRVRDLFKQAKEAAPCIIFIDEIDAVGRQRGAGLGGGHDEREQTLNQLLVEMDGFEDNSAVILIAATNRPDILDPALLRPGRFDAAVSLYTSFGYCDTIEEDMQILRNIAASLREGGWFILEMTGREISVRDFTEGEWFERGGFTVLTEFSVVGAWEALRSRWILIDKDGRRIDHTYEQRLYSAVELKRLMLAAGLSSVEIYGDFDFSPYNEKARTMVLVGRR